MINMDEPTNFHRLRGELEEFLMAAVCVAGKTAHVQAARLHRFLYEPEYAQELAARTPFEKVRVMLKHRRLFSSLQRVGMGKYHLIWASFQAMVRDPALDLWTAPWERLTEIPGIKIKTAKFFVLHSRPDQRLAVLDTHMHKKLKAAGYGPPPFPPPNPNDYTFWERIVLKLADAAGQAAAEFDLRSWKEFRRPPRSGGPSGSHPPPLGGGPARPGAPRSRA